MQSFLAALALLFGQLGTYQLIRGHWYPVLAVTAITVLTIVTCLVFTTLYVRWRR